MREENSRRLDYSAILNTTNWLPIASGPHVFGIDFSQVVATHELVSLIDDIYTNLRKTTTTAKEVLCLVVAMKRVDSVSSHDANAGSMELQLLALQTISIF